VISCSKEVYLIPTNPSFSAVSNLIDEDVALIHSRINPAGISAHHGSIRNTSIHTDAGTGRRVRPQSLQLLSGGGSGPRYDH
jgi:hypothetical protein